MIDKVQFTLLKVLTIFLMFVMSLGIMYGLSKTVDDRIAQLNNPTTEQIRQVQEMINDFMSPLIIINVIGSMVIASVKYPKEKSEGSKVESENKG